MADADRIRLSILKEATFGVTPLGVAAQGTLTIAVIPGDTETVTIDAKTYTFQTALTNVDGNVLRGGSATASRDNLLNAINLGPGSGTAYAALTTLHPTVSGTASGANALIATAKSPGVAGDSIATTETMAGGGNVWGDTTLGDTTAGVDAQFQDLRITGETLKQETATERSAELTDDRQTTDVVRTDVNAGGDINVESTFGTFDDLFEAVYQSAGFSTLLTETEVTFSMVNSTNSLDRSGGDFVADGYLPNQWLQTSGFTTAANNSVRKILSVASGSIVFATGTVVDEAEGASITAEMGEQIVNGTTQPSFSIEKEFTDLTNEFEMFLGMTLEGFTLAVEAAALLTGAFTFSGKKSESASTAAGTIASAPANSNPVMAAIDDVKEILEAQGDFDVTSFGISQGNNLRMRTEVAELGPKSIGAGKSLFSGTLQAYFEDKAIVDKYLNFTETSLAIILEDGLGNVYVFDFPRVHYTDAGRNATGENTDVIADLTWEAFKSATEGITGRLVRFAV